MESEMGRFVLEVVVGQTVLKTWNHRIEVLYVNAGVGKLGMGVASLL
jgi:hypothetical protein